MNKEIGNLVARNFDVAVLIS